MKLKSIILILIFSIAVPACVPSKDKGVALKAIEQFHSQYNNNQFAELYESADQKAKDTIAKDDFVEDMKAMRLGQGAVLKSEEKRIDYNYAEGMAILKITVLVSFEKGTATEDFSYRIVDGKPQLLSYHFLGPKAD